MEGNLLKLTIEDMADTGQGVARFDGMVCFVDKGIVGDEVLAKIIEKKKNYYVCEAVDLIKPSEFRDEGFTELVRAPFGLDLMPLCYDAENQLKANKVRAELAKALGTKFDDARLNPIIYADNRYRYRNKGVFPFRYVNGRNVCGSFERLSHNIKDDYDNLSMPESFAVILEEIMKWLDRASFNCYDEARHCGTLRYVTIRQNYEGEHLLLLTLKEDRLPEMRELSLELENRGIKIAGILKTVKEERGNTPFGKSISLLYGSERLIDKIGDVSFSLSVNSFFQVSRDGCEKLYDEVYRFAGLESIDNLMDVYCGVGSIGIYLLSKHKNSSDLKIPKLWALESIEEAVKDARLNAALNNIGDARFEYGYAENVLNKHLSTAKCPDLIIVDPPRKGLEKSVIDALIKAAPAKIIYVSCKVSTLARDLKILCDSKYKLEEVSPVNLFPLTMHVETIALLSKLDVD